MIQINQVLTGNINRCVSWYLMASYMYYKCDLNIMPDSDYDHLAHRIVKEWENITHPHKKFLTIEQDNSTVSGYNIGEYPLIVQFSAHQVYRELNPIEEKKDKKMKQKTLF